MSDLLTSHYPRIRESVLKITLFIELILSFKITTYSFNRAYKNDTFIHYTKYCLINRATST